jgi:hypothetical protein
VVTERARDANDRAELAFNRATEAVKHGEDLEAEAAVLRTRTEREIDARIELEKGLLWDGPRDRLLYSKRDLFNKTLKQFAGQRFRMSICRPDLGQEMFFNNSEIGLAAQALRVLLTENKWVPSEWPNWPPMPLMIEGCSGVGIRVDVSSNALEKTRETARELRSIIGKALSQKVFPSEGIAPPLWGIAKFKDSFPPDEIEIHVGKHPVVPGDSSKTVRDTDLKGSRQK